MVNRRKLHFLIPLTIIVYFSSLYLAASAYPTLVVGEGQSRLGDWFYHYQIAYNDGDYIIDYSYARDSPSDVEAAATALNSAAARLAKQHRPFRATIIFTRPLRINEFRAFTQATGVAPTQSLIFGEGASYKAGIPPVRGEISAWDLLWGKPIPVIDPIDEAALARWHLNDVKINAVATELGYGTYTAARRSSYVYAVDVLEQLLIDRVKGDAPWTPTSQIHVRDSLLNTAVAQVGTMALSSNNP